MLRRMKRGGFSLIEIVITITILTILVALAIVSMNASQIESRDAERRSDVEAIAMQFEMYYQNASPDQLMSGGSYPGQGYVNESELKSTIAPEADPQIFRAPGIKNNKPISIVGATNASESTTFVSPQPTPTTYVYQAISANGTSLCHDPFISEPCRRFNLYYFQEKDGTIQRVRSKNQ